MIRIGLTGSIAMGKSTTAKLFAERGAPVHDSDKTVRRLYAKGGTAAAKIKKLAPNAVIDGRVDRERLKAAIARRPGLLKQIEAIVHPLVLESRRRFERKARAAGAAIVVFDIPLLFETGGDREMDVIVVATTTAKEQRRRAMARPGMTEATFERLLAKQTPDAEKRRRATYLVDTGRGIEDAARQVDAILADLRVMGEPAL